MVKINEIYRCNHCGNMVEAIVEGAGELVCCGEAMELLEPRQLPEGGVKHIPVEPKAVFDVNAEVEDVKAIEYCNIHGLWHS